MTSIALSVFGPTRVLAAFVTPGYLTPADVAIDAIRTPPRERVMMVPLYDEKSGSSGSDQRSDIELVRAMSRGDERAATQLYDRHGAVLYGLALRIVRDAADAEEAVLETMAQAWRDATRFDEAKASVIAWMTMMTRSRALDMVRARQRREKMTDSAGNEPQQPVAMSQETPLADVQLEQTERAGAVVAALATLPVAQREVIELAFFEGLTHPEVASRLREPLGTVKTRIRLGMQKLRETLVRWSPTSSEGAS